MAIQTLRAHVTATYVLLALQESVFGIYSMTVGLVIWFLLNLLDSPLPFTSSPWFNFGDDESTRLVFCHHCVLPSWKLQPNRNAYRFVLFHDSVEKCYRIALIGPEDKVQVKPETQLVFTVKKYCQRNMFLLLKGRKDIRC